MSYRVVVGAIIAGLGLAGSIVSVIAFLSGHASLSATYQGLRRLFVHESGSSRLLFAHVQAPAYELSLGSDGCTIQNFVFPDWVCTGRAPGYELTATGIAEQDETSDRRTTVMAAYVDALGHLSMSMRVHTQLVGTDTYRKSYQRAHIALTERLSLSTAVVAIDTFGEDMPTRSYYVSHVLTDARGTCIIEVSNRLKHLDGENSKVGGMKLSQVGDCKFEDIVSELDVAGIQLVDITRLPDLKVQFLVGATSATVARLKSAHEAFDSDDSPFGQ